MSKRSAQRAGGRLEEIAGVAVDALETADLGTPSRPVLVAADRAVVDALRTQGHDVKVWARWADQGMTATSWPAEGACSAAVLRLPGGWDNFSLSLHAICARLPEGAPVWFYGGNDEGITSLDRHLDGLVTGLETIALKRRTRVLAGIRTAQPARGDMAAWRSVFDVAVPGLSTPLPLVSYPGCFAHGRLDAGTALLLEQVPEIKAGARILDFTSGSGIIAMTLARRTPDLQVTLLDADALALAAAAENLPAATRILADGWAGVTSPERFDLIVANPPIHRGREEDFAVLEGLLREGPKRLRLSGAMYLVVQRTAGVGRLISTAVEAKRHADKVAETPAFQVWRITP